MTPKACRNCGATIHRTQPYCSDCEFMTPQEAIKRLRISQKTFYRWVKLGKLHPKHVGVGNNGKRLLLRAEVDALLS